MSRLFESSSESHLFVFLITYRCSGFVVNFLDWTKLKDKSDIYKRFADCHLEFDLTRVSGAMVPGFDSATLAKSENADQLTDENSIVVKTNSLHGEWQNRVGSLTGWAPAWYPGAVAGIVLAALVLSFLTASTLVERQLHRNLLYKVMPRRAIMKLQRGQTVLEKFNVVTIFFSDIVGFTNMAGNMRPIQVMKVSEKKGILSFQLYLLHSHSLKIIILYLDA